MNALRHVALAAFVCITACGRGHKNQETSTAGGSGTQPVSASPASTTASAPKEGCLACRELRCASEHAACEAEPVCARDLGCSDECKGDKACMGKCMHPQAKFAAYGQCLVAKCKSECISH